MTADHVLVKGAADAVLSKCCADTVGAAPAMESMSSQGLRVLAVASRVHGGAPALTADDAEVGLTLLGLLGFQDPPRPKRAAIAACRQAGIKVIMITGDHPLTARSIAELVGLRVAETDVLVGADLPADVQVLGVIVYRDGVVIARVSPEDKLRIVTALRARGHIVAMTGDGVNDGPVLREADIGIAMGASGSDVAREAADLVLLDDNFATIVAAVEQGRATFANARRFLTYHLTDNVAELTPFAYLGVVRRSISTRVGVLQVLALDIGTDTLSATALGAEAPTAHVMDQPPTSGRLLDRTVATRASSASSDRPRPPSRWLRSWSGCSLPGGDRELLSRRAVPSPQHRGQRSWPWSSRRRRTHSHAEAASSRRGRSTGRRIGSSSSR